MEFWAPFYFYHAWTGWVWNWKPSQSKFEAWQDNKNDIDNYLTMGQLLQIRKNTKQADSHGEVAFYR